MKEQDVTLNGTYDIHITVDGNEVLFTPQTARGSRWIEEERGVHCDQGTVYAAYWYGNDKWSSERTDEYPDAISEMLRDHLILDWSLVPEEMRV